MNMAAFWDVEPCRLVEICRCFEGPYYSHHQSDRPESESISETLVNFKSLHSRLRSLMNENAQFTAIFNKHVVMLRH
jgi:xylose isomerase